MAAAALLSIGALLLLISGAAKLVDPAPTAGALMAMRLPSQKTTVRALGGIEILVGAFAIEGSWSFAPAAVAILYAGFTMFVVAAIRAGRPIQSCGCFGRVDTPPSPSHVIVNILIAAAAAWVWAVPQPSMLDRIIADPALGSAYLGMAILGTWTLYLILAELPRMLSVLRATP